MEKIISPGLQHLAENIFLNLNGKDLQACQLINRTANQILSNSPMFWVKKWNQKSYWFKLLWNKEEMNSNKEKPISLYLKWNFMNDEVYFIPGYTYKIVQDDFRQKIHQGVLKGHTDAIKILAPLTDNPNAPDEDGIIQYIG